MLIKALKNPWIIWNFWLEIEIFKFQNSSTSLTHILRERCTTLDQSRNVPMALDHVIEISGGEIWEFIVYLRS